MFFLFQQESDESFKQPWPVVFTTDPDAEDGNQRNIVHGRPDADHLAGFVDDTDDLVLKAIDVSDPVQLVGLSPLYAGRDGRMFTVPLKVRTAQVYDVGLSAISNLRLSEGKLRDAYDRTQTFDV